jgi:hypothetical protein
VSTSQLILCQLARWRGYKYQTPDISFFWGYISYHHGQKSDIICIGWTIKLVSFFLKSQIFKLCEYFALLNIFFLIFDTLKKNWLTLWSTLYCQHIYSYIHIYSSPLSGLSAPSATPAPSAVLLVVINILSYIMAKIRKRIYILYPFQFYFSIKNIKFVLSIFILKISNIQLSLRKVNCEQNTNRQQMYRVLFCKCLLTISQMLICK